MSRREERSATRGYSAHRVLQLSHNVRLATDVTLVLTKARTKAGLRAYLAIGPCVTLLYHLDVRWQGPMGVRVEPQAGSRHDERAGREFAVRWGMYSSNAVERDACSTTLKGRKDVMPAIRRSSIS